MRGVGKDNSESLYYFRLFNLRCNLYQSETKKFNLFLFMGILSLNYFFMKIQLTVPKFVEDCKEDPH